VLLEKMKQAERNSVTSSELEPMICCILALCLDHLGCDQEIEKAAIGQQEAIEPLMKNTIVCKI
jgi:hypothetical protein